MILGGVVDNIARSTSPRRLEAIGVVLVVLDGWLGAYSQIGCSSAASRVKSLGMVSVLSSLCFVDGVRLQSCA